MTASTQKKLVLLATLLAAFLVYLWFYPLNKGQLSVMTGLTDYTLVLGDQKTACPKDPCFLTLPTGNVIFSVEKDKYQPASGAGAVKRGKTAVVTVALTRIYQLVPSGTLPRTPVEKPGLPLPAPLQKPTIRYGAWSPGHDQVVYLDEADSRVKVWSKGTAPRLITSLKNITGPLDFRWPPAGDEVLGVVGVDLYWINLKTGSRLKQITAFLPSSILWSPQGDFILFSDPGGHVYRADAQGQTPRVLPMSFDLSAAAWEDGTTLLAARTEKGFTSIVLVDPTTATERILISRRDFPVDEIVYPGGPLAYFHQSAEKAWYELEL